MSNLYLEDFKRLVLSESLVVESYDVWTGQLKVVERSLENIPTIRKQLREMHFDHDPGNACSNSIQINSDSLRQGALIRH